jgi:hypothetical protein
MSRGRVAAAALLSGAAVMVVELLVARAMGAFFGTSLYVWTSVIGVTMLSLSIGYVWGGRWADREGAVSRARKLLLAGGAILLILPWISPVVMSIFLGLGLQAGSLLTSAMLLLAPLAALAAITPILIRAGTSDVNQGGRVAGMVYGLSTLGGIAASLGTALLLVPHIGVTATGMSVGALQVALTLGYIGRE